MELKWNCKRILDGTRGRNVDGTRKVCVGMILERAEEKILGETLK